MNKSAQIDFFYKLSSVLTGFNLVKLYGTGQGDFYFKTLKEILGEDFVSEMLNVFEVIAKQVPPAEINALGEAVKSEIFVHRKWGPVCKNIIKMWYMGNWYQLPNDWRENNVFSVLDQNKVLSANSYIQGLVWDAMGKHPKSAKQPGYGTWAFPPQTS